MHKGHHGRLVTCAEAIEQMVRDCAFLARYAGRCPDLYAIRRKCTEWHKDIYHR